MERNFLKVGRIYKKNNDYGFPSFKQWKLKPFKKQFYKKNNNLRNYSHNISDIDHKIKQFLMDLLGSPEDLNVNSPWCKPWVEDRKLLPSLPQVSPMAIHILAFQAVLLLQT